MATGSTSEPLSCPSSWLLCLPIVLPAILQDRSVVLGKALSGESASDEAEGNHKAVAYFFDMPHVTADMAAQFSAVVNERLGGRQPDGGFYHAEGPTEAGGWWAFNVWESEAHFTRFFEAFMLPAAEQVGMTPPESLRLVIAWDTSQLPGEPLDETRS